MFSKNPFIVHFLCEDDKTFKEVGDLLNSFPRRFHISCLIREIRLIRGYHSFSEF